MHVAGGVVGGVLLLVANTDCIGVANPAPSAAKMPLCDTEAIKIRNDDHE
jgi:hypothetical protein